MKELKELIVAIEGWRDCQNIIHKAFIERLNKIGETIDNQINLINK